MSTLPPSAVDAEFQRAYEHHRAGRVADAAALYERVVAAAPSHADALHLLGSIKAQSGQPAEGERLIAAALRIKPDVPLMWSNHGNALALLERRDDAIRSYDRALALAPGFVEARYNRCNHLVASLRASEALADMESALAATPGHTILETGRGTALLSLGRLNEALAAYDAAIALNSRNVDALAGRGQVLLSLNLPTEALAAFDRVLALVSGHLESIIGKAQAQTMTGRAAESLATLDRVLAVVPRNGLAHYARGHAQLALQRTMAALESFKTAAELLPDMSEARYNHANALLSLGRFDEALPVFESVLVREPSHTHAVTGLAMAAGYCCNWTIQDRLIPLIEDNVRSATRGQRPFAFLSQSSSRELQLACASAFASQTCPIPETPLQPAAPAVATAGAAADKRRIRIGYLSSDFRRHAMAYQMAELFEIHDRDRFEIVGFSGGPDDGSLIRRRIAAAFDAFHDVAASTNEEIARRIHAGGIDVLVDLNGHTIHSRIGALAWRPAHAQATYLGFPGTSGASFVDYVIADATVAPMSEQPFFTERIVHLPDCYQVSDRQRAPAAKVPTRSACGLPENAFVFCCFNTSYKISSEIFDVWMRILQATPGSVLWLVNAGDAMVGNLRRAASARGVEPGRIVFCGMVEPAEHIARHAMADLFLDTLPYNSHGTGSFALWAGLPILTCLGPAFAGRVAASLLRAVRLPELVSQSIEEYEAKAIALASDRQRLDELRARLANNRDTTPLFDTDRFARHIELAYTTMHETAMRGEAPRSFTVQAID